MRNHIAADAVMHMGSGGERRQGMRTCTVGSLISAMTPCMQRQTSLQILRLQLPRSLSIMQRFSC